MPAKGLSGGFGLVLDGLDLFVDLDPRSAGNASALHRVFEVGAVGESRGGVCRFEARNDGDVVGVVDAPIDAVEQSTACRGWDRVEDCLPPVLILNIMVNR